MPINGNGAFYVGAFDYISDNYPKYVISNNEEDYSTNGIIHINIFKFLMDEDF